MPFPITQQEYVTYTRCLSDVKVIEQCNRKNELFRIGFLQGRFVKNSQLPKAAMNCKSILELLNPSEVKELESKINFINEIHAKLKQRSVKDVNSDDYSAVSAESYNTYQKTISAWNNVFDKGALHIDLPAEGAVQLSTTFNNETCDQIKDKKALDRYFELLTNHPKLKRSGDLNDYKKGTYEVVYDAANISEIRKEVYQRLFTKAKSQGLTDSQADEQAANFSRPGVVAEDQFWLWIRDVVISPQGFRHTYNRLVWKCDLDRVGGAAALPIISENGNNKIVLQLIFRHATNSWEFEMTRGGSKPNESSMDTAKREILEETGFVAEALVQLGSINPDSGLTASVVPVFLGKVTAEKESKQDKTEAIKGKYAFTLPEIMEGFKRGYIQVDIDGKPTQVSLKDPFLAYAILMAQHNKLL